MKRDAYHTILSWKELEEIRGNFDLDTVYEVDGAFAVSPDGSGLYWYDTKEEAKEENFS